MTQGGSRRRGPEWRGVLVSVRSVAEAVEAVEGGAAIIDVKEPGRGPLGCADSATADAIGAAVAGRVPWTVACGELAAGPDRAARLPVRCSGTTGAAVPPAGAKAGPAGLSAAAWRRRFATFAAALPTATTPIAVAYADWAAAAAPSPEAIIDGATHVAACSALLIDTFDKDGPALFELVSPATVCGWLAAARDAGFATAIAGRLTLDSLPRAAALGADVVAIRGAACDGGRCGQVRRARVEAACLCYGRAAVGPAPVAGRAIVPSESVS